MFEYALGFYPTTYSLRTAYVDPISIQLNYPAFCQEPKPSVWTSRFCAGQSV